MLWLTIYYTNVNNCSYLPEELEGSCSLGGDEGGCPPTLPLRVGGVLDVVGVTGVLVGGTDQC